MTKKYTGVNDFETYKDSLEQGAATVGGEKSGWSLVGDFFNGLWNDITGKSAMTQSYQQQESLLNQQNQFTLDMWNRQNAYNDPSAQMERMKAAGINPNLAAGAIAGNGSTAASVQSSSAPSVGANPEGVRSALQTLSGLANPIFDSVKKIFDMRKEKAETKMIEEQTKGQDIENEWLPKRYQSEIDRIAKQNLVDDELIRIYHSDANFRDQLNSTELQNKQAQYNLLCQEVTNKMKEYELMTQEIKNKIQEIKESESRIGLNAAYAAESNMRKELYDVNKNFEQWRLSTASSLGIDPLSSPLDAWVLKQTAFGEQGLKRVEKLGQGLASMQKQVAEVQEKAKADASWSYRREIPVDVGVGPFKTSTSLLDPSQRWIFNPRK